MNLKLRATLKVKSQIDEVSQWNGRLDGGKSRFNEFIPQPRNYLKPTTELLTGGISIFVF
jgi:hypothetical protein